MRPFNEFTDCPTCGVVHAQGEPGKIGMRRSRDDATGELTMIRNCAMCGAVWTESLAGHLLPTPTVSPG